MSESAAVRILVGDVLEGLAALPAASVQCRVTSPPYWGLRDYGTASWEGGNPACDHAAPTRQSVNGQLADRTFTANRSYKCVCGAVLKDRQIGLEGTPEEYVAKMVEVFRAVARVLREDGTLWLNLGDSYASGGRGGNPTADSSTLQGSLSGQEASMVKRNMAVPTGLKPKDLCMMPWRVAMALQADGWWIRSVISWAKKSPMPESVTDRPTSSWEPIFLMTRSESYFYDAEGVKEASTSTGGASFGKVEKMDEAREAGQGARRYERPDYRKTGRNMRNVWHLGPEPYPEAHFATFPSEIPRRAIKAGTSEKGCCPRCMAGWRRVTDVEVNSDGRKNVGERHGAGYAVGRLDARGKCPSGLQTSTRTVAWEPSCSCGEAGTVPCVVLDPFLGSGTTVAVARELGRHGVGCELNPSYAELARDRVGRAESPLTYQSSKVVDSPLFAGVDGPGGGVA